MVTGVRQVMAGDEISIRMEFQHNANISGIEAMFSRVGDGGEIEFYVTRNNNPSVFRRAPGELTTQHVAVLVADVGEDDFPGVYQCSALKATTAGGSEIHFSQLPDFAFEVVQEPKGPPELQSFRHSDEPIPPSVSGGFSTSY